MEAMHMYEDAVTGTDARYYFPDALRASSCCIVEAGQRRHPIASHVSGSSVSPHWSMGAGDFVRLHQGSDVDILDRSLNFPPDFLYENLHVPRTWFHVGAIDPCLEAFGVGKQGRREVNYYYECANTSLV
ncbi:hypothetical protein TgHK011_005895 [Trichoderma gracile]|nr:hypothetical protein TgHK011_005895 [Trichoderma gracile]